MVPEAWSKRPTQAEYQAASPDADEQMQMVTSGPSGAISQTQRSGDVTGLTPCPSMSNCQSRWPLSRLVTKGSGSERS